MADARVTRGRAARLARALLFAGVPAWARAAAQADLDEERTRVAAARGAARARLWYAREALLLSARYGVERLRGRRAARVVDGAASGARRAPSRAVAAVARDLRLACRQARLAPAFWLGATLTLGVAVGFNAAILGLVNAVLLKPLAAHEPGRVVRIYAQAGQRPPSAAFSYTDYRHLAAHATALTGVAAVHLAAVSMSDGRASDQLLGEIASASYFDLLGAPIAAGRGLTALDDRASADPVALISEHYWRHRMSADPSAIGRAVTIGGRPFTIAGVVDARFQGSFVGGGIDLWLPLEAALPLVGPDTATDGRRRPLQMLARLQGGLTAAQAREQLAPLAAAVAASRGEAEVRLDVVPGTLLHGRVRTTAVVFLSIVTAMVALVLLVAASNVANLLLARSLARRREVAIRMSIGAGRYRIVQQLAAEGLLLAAGASAVALAIAYASSRAFGAVSLLPGFDLRLDLAPDARLLVATCGLAALAGLAATLLPALSVTRGDALPHLKEGGASLGSRRTARLRSALVIVQVGVAVVVCVAAGLLAKSGRAAAAVDLGFDRDGVFATDIDLNERGYTAARGAIFYETLLERVGALAGVERAALASRAPLDSSSPALRVLREGESGATSMSAQPVGLDTTYYAVTPGYFETVGVPLVAGRALAATDREGRVRVAVVNEFLVKALWPGLPISEAVGRRVRIAAQTSGLPSLEGEVEIAGVAGNAKYRTVGEPAQPHLYVPFAQHYAAGMALLVRARTRPMPMAETQAAMAAIDPSVQGFFTRTLEEHTRVALLPARFAARVSTGVGAIAATLGAIGLYGLVACVAAERRREFGLRLALGASPRRIARDVMRRAVWLATAGCAAGIGVALAASRLLGSLLYGVSPADPATYAAVTAGALACAAIAAWFPARRAAQVEPVTAMRSA